MINIYTFAFNNPEFLEKQYECFKKFLKQDHQLICINNASSQMEHQGIEDMAFKLQIPSHTPELVSHSKAGSSHQQALNWAWKKIINHYGVVVILDHDMFPIKDFELYPDHDVAGVMQGRGEHIRYFHPGIMIIHPSLKDREQVDFTGDAIDGYRCDSGGNWHHYMVAHPELKIKQLSLVDVSPEHSWLFPEGMSFKDHSHGLQICNDSILHFRNGSNWAHVPPTQFSAKKDQFNKIINKYLKA